MARRLHRLQESETSSSQSFNQRHHLASQRSWTRVADNADIDGLLICHGEGFSSDKLELKRVLEIDYDTGVEGTGFQCKLNVPFYGMVTAPLGR